jgi:hypothetical protein
MASFSLLLAASTNDDGGAGFLVIAVTVLLIVLAIAAVWTFAARRGSRVPKRTPQRPDQGVRDGH